ncbi:MAG TPA: translation initiation factor IF-2 [Candidatus Pacearchaeota archaeon]|nr:translation initiation factor IF-2 [Candidatus Pacearchaeota archaeon]HPR79727.1 translation initiation factor IF-2 [Candidatus Pacearchaeota archaeon]
MAENNKQPDVISRPPVVVVLGHIDHGKTSLLMAIREFNVLEKESGGITQHVGAYQIEHNQKKITFIDTPGHESFSAIRGRGSKLADIAVLVIDAGEGVKKQTKEAIALIKNAKLTTIVALNKMDKPGANPEMVKQQLSKEDILVESWGGQVPTVEISAKTGQGITDLLDMIQLVAEVEDLKAETGVLAEGTIVEAYLDPKKGPTTTVLVENGTLGRGDFIGTDSVVGKIKNLGDFLQKEIKEADPSDPVVIIGFENVPAVGEKFRAYSSYEEAKANLKQREIKRDAFEFDPSKKYLNLVIKGDAQGSLEGIEEVLKILPQDNICIRVIRSEVGDITEQDVKMAKTSEAVIIAFRVKKDKVAEISAENNKVKVYDFSIIYELAQKVRELMERKLTKEKERIDLGEIEVLAIFRTEKNRQIVGGNVIEGEVQKGALLEIFREEEKIGHGRIIELQSNKKDFDVVKKGKECGILYQGSERIKEGDTLVVFKEEYKQEEL